MWEVHYSQEAGSYLEDNTRFVAHLFIAIEALARSDGWPSIGDYQEIQGNVYWVTQNHLVVYRRMQSEQVLFVTYIKPR
jgi:hypothetical protein